MGDRLAIAGMGSMKIEIPTMKDYLVKASSPNNGMNIKLGNAKDQGDIKKEISMNMVI